MKSILCFLGLHKETYGEWYIKKSDVWPVSYLKCERCSWSELGAMKVTAMRAENSRLMGDL